MDKQVGWAVDDNILPDILIQVCDSKISESIYCQLERWKRNTRRNLQCRILQYLVIDYGYMLPQVVAVPRVEGHNDGWHLPEHHIRNPTERCDLIELLNSIRMRGLRQKTTELVHSMPAVLVDQANT